MVQVRDARAAIVAARIDLAGREAYRGFVTTIRNRHAPDGRRRRAMDRLVTYELRDSIATIAMDDGKRNALSIEMLTEINRALDRAAADRAVVVLTGREEAFSGGFDLRALAGGGSDAYAMVRMGFELAERMLSFPAPVVVACTGHAIAMGAFLLLSGDYRLGAAGAYKIGANEVAIGITMPFFGVEICRQRLAPAHFHRAVINAEIYGPDEAVAAGFLDRVVAEPELHDAARTAAAGLARLDPGVHAATKLRAREHAIRSIRAAIDADAAALRATA
jgi:enoyl-CoA hydratase